MFVILHFIASYANCLRNSSAHCRYSDLKLWVLGASFCNCYLIERELG